MEHDANIAQERPDLVMLEFARAASHAAQWAYAAIDRPKHRARVAELAGELLPLAERMAGAESPAATQEMIEAGWEALDREGLSCPPVKTMDALWRAMWAAR